jgi:hypothetical protein
MLSFDITAFCVYNVIASIILTRIIEIKRSYIVFIGFEAVQNQILIFAIKSLEAILEYSRQILE